MLVNEVLSETNQEEVRRWGMKHSNAGNRGAMLLVPAFCCFFLLDIAGCSKQSHTTESPSDVRVEAAGDSSVISVSGEAQVPLAIASSRRFFGELQVNGVVTPDVNRTVPVLSLSGGRVLDMRAKLGDEVKKGQVLMRINSNDASQAFSDYQKFKASEVLARRQLTRAQELYAKGAIAQKDLETAEDAEQKAKVDVTAAGERLHLLGADAQHPSAILEIRAPIAGTIVEQNIAAGTGVRSLDASPNLFTVADLSRVWILCDLYENNLSQVGIGDQADVQLTAYPDKKLKAKVSNIGRVLDPNTRTAKVRLELDNKGGVLRPGMFATVTFTSRRSEERVVVPSTAVMRLHDKDWVFVALDGKRFRRTEVQIGPRQNNGQQEILSGVKAGDRIVTNALEFSSTVEK